MRPEIRRWLRWLSAAGLILILAACGGGSSTVASNGVGTGGTGVSSGTVTGFGSVILDGDAYDSAAPDYLAGTDTDEAAPAAALAVGLGAQVTMHLDAQGRPIRALVDPELDGAVTRIDTSLGTFVVQGVTVVVNSNPAAGPVTVFSGLTGLDPTGSGPMTVGMQVQVHGVFGVDGGGAGYIQATRVRQLASTNPVSRVSGRVTRIDSTSFDLAGQTFSLAGMTVQPAGASLAVGTYATVWTSTAPTAPPPAVRVHGVQTASGSARIAGLVYHLSGTRFEVSGAEVDASAPALAATLAGLTNGRYVTVHGTIAGGVVVADAITPASAAPVQVELKGTITHYVSASNFSVRGVVVDASSAVFAPQGSSAAALGDGVYVEITGQASGNLVTASTVQVTGSSPEGGIVDIQGTVSGYDAGSGSFTLNWTRDGVSVTSSVTLAANVAFVNGSASGLGDGVTVEIEGATGSGGAISAYSVRYPGVVASGSENEVQGTVYSYTGSSAGTPSFVVNGVVIQQNGVTPSGGTLADGVDVDVTFTSSGGVNLATAISIGE